jgi:hypothetical protein
MAWYSITGTCGHTFRKQLYGKITSRESYVEWAEDNLLCPDCFKKQQEKEKDDAAKKALEKAKKEKLPELEGTEKQIRWALVLREKQIDFLYTLIGEALDENDKGYAEYLKGRIEARKKETSAKFFINRKDNWKHDFEIGYKEFKRAQKGKEFCE